MRNIESIFNKWVQKLKLKKFDIRLRVLNEAEKFSIYIKGYIAMMRWNYKEHTWELLTPRNIQKPILIHELGHIFFPKKIDDMKLAPRVKNFEEMKNLNSEISFCINQILDCFINYHLSEFDEFYTSWVDILVKELNIRILENWSLYKKFAFFLLHYIEYKYVFKKPERIKYESKINSLFNYIENIFVSDQIGKDVIITKKKLNQIKKKMDEFNNIKNSKNSFKIRSIMYDTLKISDLWDEIILYNHFRIRFGVEIP